MNVFKMHLRTTALDNMSTGLLSTRGVDKNFTEYYQLDLYKRNRRRKGDKSNARIVFTLNRSRDWSGELYIATAYHHTNLAGLFEFIKTDNPIGVCDSEILCPKTKFPVGGKIVNHRDIKDSGGQIIANIEQNPRSASTYFITYGDNKRQLARVYVRQRKVVIHGATYEYSKRRPQITLLVLQAAFELIYTHSDIGHNLRDTIRRRQVLKPLRQKFYDSLKMDRPCFVYLDPVPEAGERVYDRSYAIDGLSTGGLVSKLTKHYKYNTFHCLVTNPQDVRNGVVFRMDGLHRPGSFRLKVGQESAGRISEDKMIDRHLTQVYKIDQCDEQVLAAAHYFKIYNNLNGTLAATVNPEEPAGSLSIHLKKMTDSEDIALIIMVALRIAKYDLVNVDLHIQDGDTYSRIIREIENNS